MTAGVPAAPGPSAGSGPIELRPADNVTVNPADWEARATQVRQSLAQDGLEEASLAEALDGFRFLDDAGGTWSYDGTAWRTWSGATTRTGTPPTSLRLQPFTLDLVPEVPEEVTAGVPAVEDGEEPLPTGEELAAAHEAPITSAQVLAAASGSADFPAIPPSRATVPVSPVGLMTQPPPQPAVAAAQPAVIAGPPLPPAASPVYRATHVVPAGGLPAWSRPDPALAPENRLAPGLDVMIAASYGSGWARIVCSNTWSAWVDGRFLVPIGAPRGAAPGLPVQPPAPAAPAAPAVPAPGAPGASARLKSAYSELGGAASLGFLAWPAIVFLAPDPLRLTLLGSPELIGLAVGALFLLGKLVSRRSLRLSDLVLAVLDGIVAVLVFTVVWQLL